MPDLVGIRFPYTLKTYDFIQGSKELKARDFVIVETEQGEDIGQVVYVGKKSSEKSPEDMKTIKRVATKEDIEKSKELAEEAKSLMPLFVEKAEKYKLKMSPVGISYSFDKSSAVFYFTSDGRVDFREIAKDLSRSIKIKAVMRQIGPRDEAKMVGGYGRCGLPVCCATFLVASDGVTMENAEKAYGMPKSAGKISGVCGRLMCCINFEEEKGKRK